MGSGQDVFEADNTHYWKRNTYQIEYYFTTKANQTKPLLRRLFSKTAIYTTKARTSTSKVKASLLFTTTFKRKGLINGKQG